MSILYRASSSPSQIRPKLSMITWCLRRFFYWFDEMNELNWIASELWPSLQLHCSTLQTVQGKQFGTWGVNWHCFWAITEWHRKMFVHGRTFKKANRRNTRTHIEIKSPFRMLWRAMRRVNIVATLLYYCCKLKCARISWKKRNHSRGEKSEEQKKKRMSTRERVREE